MPRKPQSGRRQAIDVWRLHPRLAITAQLRPQVIDGDEEKVWLAVRFSVGCACHEAADEDGKWTIHQILVKNKAKVVSVFFVFSVLSPHPTNATTAHIKRSCFTPLRLTIGPCQGKGAFINCPQGNVSTPDHTGL